MIKKRLTAMIKANIFTCINTGKALVNGSVISFDKNVKSYKNEDCVMLPLEFSVKALGGTDYKDKKDRISFRNSEGEEIVIILSDERYITEEKNNIVYICAEDIAKIFTKDYFFDRCGYLLIGDNLYGLTLEDEKTRDILSNMAAEVTYDRPKAQEIMDSLKKTHPRVLLTKERVETLKALIGKDELFTKLYSKLLEDTEKELAENLAAYEMKDGKRLLEVSRRVLHRIMRLSLAFLLSGDKRFSKRAIEELINVSNFPDWNPVHFLDASEMTAATAIGYDWLYDIMSEDERKCISGAIVKNGLEEIILDFNLTPGRKRTWEWSNPENGNFPNNWVSVCCGGMILGALAVGEEESQLCGMVIEKGLRLMEYLLKSFAPDGAWYEGPGYWEYAVMYFNFASVGLKTAVGTDYGISSSVGMDNSCRYIIDVVGPGGSFNLDDGGSPLLSVSVISAFAYNYNNAYFKKERLRQIEKYNKPTASDILYYSENLNITEDDQENLDSYFRGSSVVAMRSGREDNDMFLGFHGGQNGHGHCHLDAGSFIFDCFGKRWALDLGVEPKTYYVKTMDDRYTYYRYRAEGHNTFIINPDRSDDQDRYAIPVMEECHFGKDISFAICDLTEVYKKRGVTKAKRGVLMNKKQGEIIVRDEICMTGKMEYYWFMHTEAEIELCDNGKRAILIIGNDKIELELTSENQCFEIMEALPLPSSPFPSDSIENTGVKKLAVHISAEDELNAEVIIKTKNFKDSSPYINSKLINWKYIKN